MTYALHRLALRRFARASVRRQMSAALIEIAAGGTLTADPAGGCAGPAPEGTSGALAAGALIPANAGPPQTIVVPIGPIGGAREKRERPKQRIDLTAAPSGMERAADDWRGEPLAVPEAPPLADGKIWCGPCDARVPGWFGKDCISGECPLKSKKRAAA